MNKKIEGKFSHFLGKALKYELIEIVSSTDLYQFIKCKHAKRAFLVEYSVALINAKSRRLWVVIPVG